MIAFPELLTCWAHCLELYPVPCPSLSISAPQQLWEVGVVTLPI